MKQKLLIILITLLFPLCGVASQWDDTFLKIIAEKDKILPYDIAEGYQVFDITYNTETRTFTNHIQTISPKLTKEMIKAEYERDMSQFCINKETQASLEQGVIYQVLFYKTPQDKPMLTITIDNDTCKNIAD